jgi:hypothetical protein
VRESYEDKKYSSEHEWGDFIQVCAYEFAVLYIQKRVWKYACHFQWVEKVKQSLQQAVKTYIVVRLMTARLSAIRASHALLREKIPGTNFS